MNLPQGFYAQITSSPYSGSSSSSSSGSCSNPVPGYGWQSLNPQTDGGFNASGLPQSGTQNVNSAYEINGNQSIQPGDIVWLVPGFFNASCVGQEFLFDYCCRGSSSSSSSNSSSVLPCNCCIATPAIIPVTLSGWPVFGNCHELNGSFNAAVATNPCLWFAFLPHFTLTVAATCGGGTATLSLTITDNTNLSTATYVMTPVASPMDCTATRVLGSPSHSAGWICIAASLPPNATLN